MSYEQRLAAVVDRVKLDERALDTDQYVGMILDALADLRLWVVTGYKTCLVFANEDDANAYQEYLGDEYVVAEAGVFTREEAKDMLDEARGDDDEEEDE